MRRQEQGGSSLINLTAVASCHHSIGMRKALLSCNLRHRINSTQFHPLGEPNMADPSPQSFSFDFGANGGKFTFESMEDLQKFAEAEVAFWSFLEQAEQLDLPEQFKGFARTLLGRIQGLIPQIVRFNRGALSEAQLMRSFQELFYVAPKATTGQGRVPLSRTPKAQYLAAAFRSDGPVRALAAISIETDPVISQNFYQNPIALRGIISYLNYLEGLSEVEPDAIREAIELNAREYRERFESDTLKFEKLHQQSADLIRRGERLQAISARWTQHRWKRRNSNIRSELDRHVAAFKQTEDTYKTFMKLKAPAEYWEQKAKGHDIRTLIFGCVSALWAVVAGGLLFLFVQSIFEKAMGLTTLETGSGVIVPINSGVLLILGAQGLIASTIVFWIARVLVRLFLSELHLAMDARERTTMVQCYLALSEEGEVEESSLHIVLQSLFRPTQDGIVKDDASNDLTPGGLLSRALSK